MKKRSKKKEEPLVYEQLSLNGFRVAKGYYTTREVAELYHVTPHTVCNWINRGWLEASRPDGKKKAGNWHIHPQSIEDIDRATDELIRANRGMLVAVYGRRKTGKVSAVAS
jgi:Helix-turn-helix domain